MTSPGITDSFYHTDSDSIGSAATANRIWLRQTEPSRGSFSIDDNRSIGSFFETDSRESIPRSFYTEERSGRDDVSNITTASNAESPLRNSFHLDNSRTTTESSIRNFSNDSMQLRNHELEREQVYAACYMESFNLDSDENEEEEPRNEVNARQPFEKLLQMFANRKSNETITEKFIVNEIEVMLAVLELADNYALPNVGIADLCKMLNSFVARPIIPDNQYQIDERFNSGDGLEYHAVCPTCNMYISQFTRKQVKVTCTICNVDVLLKDPSYHDFFVTLDVNNEIRDLIEKNHEYYDALVSQREHEEPFRDITSGQKYKEFVNALPNEDKKSYATLTFNSDGAPAFKSSKFSVWPIQLVVNEVPVHARQQKPVKFAFWFGNDKPKMRIFLTEFVKRINTFSQNGVLCKIGDENRHIKLFALCCCVDCVARAPMQGLILFNGYYGCSWCLHPGESVFHIRGFARKFILLDEIPPRRNEADSVLHIRQALESGKPCFGFKGATPLLNLKGFDIINGMVPDPMHCIAMGVVKQITNYWFEASNKPYSLSKDHMTNIDNHVKSFKVPNQLARLSRSINDRRFWKSREWENWLLYYSLPVLAEIDHLRIYVEHWALLVQAFYLLMKDSITILEIKTADKALKKFVAQTEFYYTADAMSYNVHQLIHISQSVADWGPLWSHSGYAFESGNGQILRTVHGSRGVIHQMCRNISRTHSITLMKEHIAKKEYSPVIDYCYYLRNRCTQKTDKVGCHRYFGEQLEPHARFLEELHLSIDETRAYNKLVKARSLFQSCYKLNARSNNCFAQTVDGQFIQIVQFLSDRVNNKEYTVCKIIQVQNAFFHSCTSVQEIINIEDELTSVETKTIKNICVYMPVNRKIYISAVPNMYCY